MKFTKTVFWGLSAICAMALVSPAWATPVTGGASISGSVTVTATQIIFQSNFVAQGAISQTGSFTGLTSGVYNTAVLAGPPLTGPISIPAFMSFTTGLATPITFDLQQILPGTGTAAGCTSDAINSMCTPAGSPFTLTQRTTGVSVDLMLTGISYTGTSATGSSPTTALYTTQLTIPPNACNTITTCLALIGGGGSVTADYSANFSTSAPNIVPEPSSILMMGAGLIGFGSLARRKLKK